MLRRKRVVQLLGKSKVDTCQADWRKRFMAKKSRSYRDKDYQAHLSWAKRVNTPAGK